MVPKKSSKWSPKGTPKVSQNYQNGFQKPSQKRAPKKYRKTNMFSTPECRQSAVNCCKIDDFQVLVLTPRWVSFWRCFGRSNGGQCHQNATSKRHKKMMPKMSPNWSQRGYQNEVKIVKNEVWEAPSFMGGSQEASGPPPGSILERFWDHFGTTCVNISNIFLMIFWTHCVQGIFF